MKANKGKKIDDPFTRRSTKPCMKFRAKTNSTIDDSIATEVEESKNNIETTDIKVSKYKFDFFYKYHTPLEF